MARFIDAHTLHITKGEQGRLAYLMECPGVSDNCRAYEPCECPESKPEVGWDGDCQLDEDDGFAHGVEHREYGGEWMRPTDRCYFDHVGCFVAEAAHEDLFDAADERLGPGTYLVRAEWEEPDDELFRLRLVSSGGAASVASADTTKEKS